MNQLDALVSNSMGDTKLVGSLLPPEAFSMLDVNLSRTTEAGEFRLTLGQGELRKSVRVK